MGGGKPFLISTATLHNSATLHIVYESTIDVQERYQILLNANRYYKKKKSSAVIVK